jgi:hypothetical protein
MVEIGGVTDAAWIALRDAVAEEFIQKLPEELTEDEMCALLRVTPERLAGWEAAGRVHRARGSYGGAVYRPAENRALLRVETVLRIPLPFEAARATAIARLEADAE